MLKSRGAEVYKTDGGYSVYNVVQDDLIAIASQISQLKRFHCNRYPEHPILSGHELQHLRDHANLEEISVDGMPIDGRVLDFLPTLPKLWTLRCSPASNTNEALRNIGQCKDLRKLALNNSAIIDADLDYVRNLEHLVDFSLFGTRVGRGIKNLDKMTHLRELSLTNTVVSDRDLEVLEYLCSLKSLCISSPFFTNEGLAFVSQCKRLELFAFDSQTITSDGLQQLNRLPNLRTLTARETVPDDDLIRASAYQSY